MCLLHLLLAHSQTTILTHSLDAAARLLFVFMVHTVAHLTLQFRWLTLKTISHIAKQPQTNLEIPVMIKEILQDHSSLYGGVSMYCNSAS